MATYWDVQGAINYLSSLIDAGVEYPTAHERTIAKFELTEVQAELLTKVYDSAISMSKYNDI